MNKLLKLHRFYKLAAIIKSIILLLSLALFVVYSNLSTAQAEFGSIVDVGLGGDFYFSDESANNGQGFVNLLIQNTWSSSQLWLDFGAGGLVGDTAASFVKAPQLYYRTGSLGATHFTIGRALHDWSFSDNFWNLGIAEPIFKWNEARPEQQGLTGLFFTTPIIKNNLEFTAFFSLLFLPTQGPSYELINGKLTSSNPWFSEPVEVIDLSGEKVDLNYDIDVPKTQDVISQKSYGIQLSTPQNKKDFLINVFAMNKPRNDLILPFEGALNLSTFNGDITVIPRVARHSIGGLDIGWNSENYKTVISWLYESEVDYDIPDGTTYPIIPAQNIFSVTQLLRLSNTQRVWVGYIKVERQDTQLGGAFSSSNISTFLNRNRFEEAAQIRWEGLLFKAKSHYRVNASLAYNQSLLRDNAWVSSDIRWSLNKGVELFSQCDFFGGSEEGIVNLDFMSAYQNNDRCFVGGHYAF